MKKSSSFIQQKSSTSNQSLQGSEKKEGQGFTKDLVASNKNIKESLKNTNTLDSPHVSQKHSIQDKKLEKHNLLKSLEQTGITDANLKAIPLEDSSTEEANKRYWMIAKNTNLDASLRLNAFIQIQHLPLRLVDISEHFRALGNISMQSLQEKDILPSVELSQVYEPYWRYSEEKLRNYAKKILKQISSHCIAASDIDESNTRLSHKGEGIQVREVKEFGRVLPLLHLKEALKQTQETHLAVPRIFLILKDPQHISFTFGLPYYEEGCGLFHCSAGHNPLYIESQSFKIYQEYIEGEGYSGNSSFLYYGHCDLGRRQVIYNSKDKKQYLIDTKDSKNFFIPALNPYEDVAYTYWRYTIGRYLPQDKSLFRNWQRKQQKIMTLEKCFNYHLDMEKVDIHLGPLDTAVLDGIQNEAYFSIFEDASEKEPYFDSPEKNAARYIALGKYDLLERFLIDHPDLNFNQVLIPSKVAWLPLSTERLGKDLEYSHPHLSKLLQERANPS